MRPSLVTGWRCLGHAHREILEDAAEELVVCELHCVNHDVVAQLNDHELLLLCTRAQHVSVLLRGEDGGGRLRRAVNSMHSGRAVRRRVVETVDDGNTELRGKAFFMWWGDVRGVLLTTALRRSRYWDRRRGIVRTRTFHAVLAYGRLSYMPCARRCGRWVFSGFAESLGLPILE